MWRYGYVDISENMLATYFDALEAEGFVLSKSYSGPLSGYTLITEDPLFSGIPPEILAANSHTQLERRFYDISTGRKYWAVDLVGVYDVNFKIMGFAHVDVHLYDYE